MIDRLRDRPLRWSLLILLLTAVFAVTATDVVTRDEFGLDRDDGRVVAIQDFAAHFHFVREVWSGAGQEVDGSVYSAEFHRMVREDWVGTSEEVWTLPFGYAPTMIWILGLLAALPIPLAFLAWTLSGLLAAAGVVLHRRTQGEMAVAACLTPAALSIIAVGQTAFLTVLALLILLDRSLAAASTRGRSDVLACAVVLWLLTAKPPLALVAGAAFWALGRPRPVAAAAATAVVTTVLLTPWLGTSWPGEYVRLLSVYDTGEAPRLFAGSLGSSIQTMNNLRAFLHANIGLPDHAVARATTVLWLASLGGLVAAGRRRLLDGRAVWALAVVSYLILCPHVSATDDLHLLLIPAALAGVHEGAGRGWRDVLPWIAVPVGLALGSGPELVGDLRPSPVFVVKVGMAVWILWSVKADGGGRSRPRARSPTAGGAATAAAEERSVSSGS